MKKLVILLLAAALYVCGEYDVAKSEVPADQLDWFNSFIDQTNFRVSMGCSGTLIDLDKKYILTAGHCVDQYVTVLEHTGYGKEGEEYQYKTTTYADVGVDNLALHKFFIAKIIKFSPPESGHDLALLQLDTQYDLRDLGITQAASVASSDHTIKRGQKVYAVGNPLSHWNTLREGIISFTYRDGQGDKIGSKGIQYDAGIFYGNSGGSLYDANFTFLGVTITSGIKWTDAGLLVDPTEGFAVPYWIINKFLADAIS